MESTYKDFSEARTMVASKKYVRIASWTSCFYFKKWLRNTLSIFRLGCDRYHLRDEVHVE